MVDLTYSERKSYDKHVLRVLIHKESNPVVGMSLPRTKVEHLVGIWYTTRVEGTTIILESGCAPTVKK